MAQLMQYSFLLNNIPNLFHEKPKIYKGLAKLSINNYDILLLFARLRFKYNFFLSII